LPEAALVVLVILDGWGCAPSGPGNAVDLAETPVFDRLWAEFPHTTLKASGEAVGLPRGQMGNSEVGHLTIGSGRILYQDLMRVNKAIEDGSFFENPALRAAFEHDRVHLLGLVSYGGVHSHSDHLRALLRIAPEKTWIHAFTDGRDVSPHAAINDLAELPAERIASVCGRYYAMDRDGRWERTQRAYDAIVDSSPVTGTVPVTYVQQQYDASVTDEFVAPVHFEGRPGIEPGDAVIFFNFRPDRARQLSQKLLEAGFDLTTMTRYRDDFDCPAVFEEQEVSNTLAEVLAGDGARQLHCAETEKYAHVTYFFNGGREETWPGEERILVPSPRDVGTYDEKPEMSAPEVAARFAAEIGDGYRFGIVNFANPDMVGHTGSIPAAVAAVETTDRCLGEVLAAVEQAGGVTLVTADHGNAETMLEPDGSPHTRHTTNPVPLVVTVPGAQSLARSRAAGLGPVALRGIQLRDDGELSDLAPTCLDLLGIAPPPEMTGKTVILRPS
jgi:2,3-bisphosphoglycerate-independent phosphoglycerate mutase